MRQSKTAQNRASLRSQHDQNLAFVFLARSPGDGAGQFKPVHQFDSAVVLDEKPGRNLSNRRLYALGKSLDCQQQLMLLSLDPMLFRRGLAEMKKLPDLPPELGQVVVLIGREIAEAAIHIYIVTRYKGRNENRGPQRNRLTVQRLSQYVTYVTDTCRTLPTHCSLAASARSWTPSLRWETARRPNKSAHG